MNKNEKPELTADEAAYLIQATDRCPTTSHQDRNNMGACVNKLILIANWEDPDKPKAPPKEKAIPAAVKKVVRTPRAKS